MKMDVARSLAKAPIENFINGFEKHFILIKDSDLKRSVGGAISNPPYGVDNWVDIVITTLHYLEQYETNEKTRVAIKKALVYAIDAKNWRKNAEKQIKSPTEQCIVGNAFATGNMGVKKDPGQAAHWYRRAAEQGLAAAQLKLGECYENGFGVKKDLKQAVYWYGKAAEQGDGMAQRALRRLK